MIDYPDLTDSAEAFEILAEPVRVRLLRALWLEGRQGTVSFSRLRDAADIGDSGRFNYHLQRLTGTFIEKTDDGYQLTPAGVAVVDAVFAGMFAPPEGVEETPISSRCPTCETRLSFAYEGGYATIRCVDCEMDLTTFLFPPRGVASRESVEDVAEAFGAHSRSILDRTISGVCPYCTGRIAADSLADRDRVPEGKVSFSFTCSDCRGRVTVSAAALASFHPAVISFLHERGVDTRSPLWNQAWYHEARAAVVGEDPPSVTVTIPAEGDELELTIDEAGRITVTTER
jgi:hypothetical protein